MNQQTKNIITRKTLEDELLFTATANVRYTAVVSSAFSLFLLFFGVGLSALVLGTCQTPFELGCLIFCYVLVCGAIVLIWSRFFMAIRYRKRIQNGEFEVTAVPLSYKAERYVRRGRHASVVEEFYFADFEPYQPGHTVYQLADAADLFYLVHLTGAKHILRAYLGDMYEYKSNS